MAWIPHLEANEALHNMQVQALGANTVKKQDRTRLIRQWTKLAQGSPIKKQYTDGDGNARQRTLADLMPP